MGYRLSLCQEWGISQNLPSHFVSFDESNKQEGSNMLVNGGFWGVFMAL